MSRAEYDCQACGACCINPRHNRKNDIIDYVQVFPADALFQRKPLRTRWTVRNEDGQWHMKMDSAGRCSALEGKIASHAGCGIYEARPGVCRKLVPGTDQCITARREQGLPARP